jgi:hypothetical protein
MDASDLIKPLQDTLQGGADHFAAVDLLDPGAVLAALVERNRTIVPAPGLQGGAQPRARWGTIG